MCGKCGAPGAGVAGPKTQGWKRVLGQEAVEP